MKLEEAFSEYQYKNVGQFRAIADSLGYNQGYNRGFLHFTRPDDEFRISLEKIRSQAEHVPDISLERASMDRVCKFFDQERALSPEYKDSLSKEGISIVNWGDLKGDQRDRFTIVDHQSKVCYTGRELFEYALQNGYMLDGKGTRIEKDRLSDLTKINGKAAKLRLMENGVAVFYRKESLVIPDSVLGKKLTGRQKDDLLNGNAIVLSSRKGDVILQVDKELNAVVVRSEKELSIPKEIGGYKLTTADKYLLANGHSLDNKLLRTPEGKYIIADITISPDKKGIQFSNIQSVPEEKVKELMQKRIEGNISHKEEVKEVRMPEGKAGSRDLDAELKEAMAKNDYEKMARLREEGYKPSEEVIRGLVNDGKVDLKQAVVIEKLFGIKPEIRQTEENSRQKTEPQMGGTDKSMDIQEKQFSSPDIMESAFKEAVRNEDFKRLSQLKEQGYEPSKEAVASLSEMASRNTVIAVQKIFGIRTNSPSLAADVKLANTQRKPDTDLKRPIANTVNRMFSDL